MQRNKRKEHNVEKYIQLLTTLSLIILVYIRSAAVTSYICEIPRNCLKIRTLQFKVIQGHRSWCQSKRICNSILIQARSEGGSMWGFDWFDRTPPPLSRQQYMYTCNCCGRSCKMSNISVKIQLNLHQNEPFQVKKSQNFPGMGHSPSPEPSQLVPGTAAVRAAIKA